MAATELMPCECKSKAQLTAGWEGTAVLSHGILLRFGCLSYVFSVVQYDKMIEEED